MKRGIPWIRRQKTWCIKQVPKDVALVLTQHFMDITIARPVNVNLSAAAAAAKAMEAQRRAMEQRKRQEQQKQQPEPPSQPLKSEDQPPKDE